MPKLTYIPLNKIKSSREELSRQHFQPYDQFLHESLSYPKSTQLRPISLTLK